MVLTEATIRRLVNQLVLGNPQTREKIEELYNEVDSSDFMMLILNKHRNALAPGVQYRFEDILGLRPSTTAATGLSITVGTHTIDFDPTSRSNTVDNLRAAIVSKVTASVVKDDGSALAFNTATPEPVKVAVAAAILSKNAESFWDAVRNSFTLLPNAYRLGVFDKFGAECTLSSGTWDLAPDYMELVYDAAAGEAFGIDGIQIDTQYFAGEIIANSPITAPQVVAPKLISGNITNAKAVLVGQLLNAHLTLPGNVADIDPNDFAQVMRSFGAFASTSIDNVISSLTSGNDIPGANLIVRLPGAAKYLYGLTKNDNTYAAYKDAVDDLLPNDQYVYIGPYRASPADNSYDFIRFCNFLQDNGYHLTNDEILGYGDGVTGLPETKDSLGNWNAISAAENVGTLFIKGQNNFNPYVHVGEVSATGFIDWVKSQGINPVSITSTEFTNWKTLLNPTQLGQLAEYLLAAPDHRAGEGAFSALGAAANNGTQTDNEKLMTLLGGFNSSMYNSNANMFPVVSNLSTGVKTNLVIAAYAAALDGVDVGFSPQVLAALSGEFNVDNQSNLYGTPTSIVSAKNTIAVNAKNRDGSARTTLQKADAILGVAQNMRSILGLSAKTHANLVNTSLKTVDNALTPEEWTTLWPNIPVDVQSSIIDEYGTNETSLGIAASTLPVGYASVHAVISDATKTTAQRAQAKRVVETMLTHYMGMRVKTSTLTVAARSNLSPSPMAFAEMIATIHEHHTYQTDDERDAHAAIIVQELSRNSEILSAFDTTVFPEPEEYNKLLGRTTGNNLPIAPTFVSSGTNTFAAMASQVSESYSNYVVYYANAFRYALDNPALDLNIVIASGTNLAGPNFSDGQCIWAVAVAGPDIQLTQDDSKYLALTNAGVSTVQLDLMAIHKREQSSGYEVGQAKKYWLVEKR